MGSPPTADGNESGDENRDDDSRPTRRLSAADWAQAALRAIGEGGLAAVAVEPLAARLGTTKGSFYWHFPNRQALVDAALARWEQEHTEAIITLTDREPIPEARLRSLFKLVVGVGPRDRIEIALLATAEDPRVAPVMRRVTERRIAYVASQYEAMGLPTDEAYDRALLAVSVYLGHLQLAHAAPGTLPLEPDRWRRHVDRTLERLMLDRA